MVGHRLKSREELRGQIAQPRTGGSCTVDGQGVDPADGWDAPIGGAHPRPGRSTGTGHPGLHDRPVATLTGCRPRADHVQRAPLKGRMRLWLWTGMWYHPVRCSRPAS